MWMQPSSNTSKFRGACAANVRTKTPPRVFVCEGQRRHSAAWAGILRINAACVLRPQHNHKRVMFQTWLQKQTVKGKRHILQAGMRNLVSKSGSCSASLVLPNMDKVSCAARDWPYNERPAKAGT
eukprot:366106-Chlamydomonas_euryale.AAC.6